MSLTADMLSVLASDAALVPGTTCFEGVAPDAKNTAVALNQYAGGPPEWRAGLENPGLQAIARAPVYADALTLAMTCMHALEDVVDRTINGKHYVQVDARSSPQYLGQDLKQRHMFTTSFNVLVERN